MLGPHLTIDHRPATAPLINECAAVAARSFYTDPFFVHLGPPALLRYRGLALFFRANLRHLGRNGRISTVRTADDRVVGVAGWITTDGYPQSMYHQLASAPGTLRALYRRPRALVDGQKYLLAMAREHIKEPHWYLFLLVADPEIQRQGVGSALLTEALTHVDEEGVAAYLETQKEDNLAYYRRFGFELIGQLTPTQSGPPLYCMRRAPR
jgi:ribosomal protein S18 acetylase RimI-like enzyme